MYWYCLPFNHRIALTILDHCQRFCPAVGNFIRDRCELTYWKSFCKTLFSLDPGSPIEMVGGWLKPKIAKQVKVFRLNYYRIWKKKKNIREFLKIFHQKYEVFFSSICSRSLRRISQCINSEISLEVLSLLSRFKEFCSSKKSSLGI